MKRFRVVETDTIIRTSTYDEVLAEDEVGAQEQTLDLQPDDVDEDYAATTYEVRELRP